MAELTDTHCHIQSVGQTDLGEATTRQLWAKAADRTPQQVLDAANKAGVTRLICVGCDLEDSRLSVEFVQDKKGCWASIGLHPHEASRYAGQTAQLEQFAALTRESKVVAIGECGLDFYYEHSSKQAQLEVLIYQLELARSQHLPVIFHVRQAFDDFWPIFERYPGIRGVLHSFTDSAANLQRALDHGLYIGVNGIATFAKDEALLETYKMIPLQKLLLETDAPFLTPAPYRGSINEPKHVETIADFMAHLRGEERNKFVSVTTKNARELFGV